MLELLVLVSSWKYMEEMVQGYKEAEIWNQAEDCKVLMDFFDSYNRLTIGIISNRQKAGILCIQ